MPCPICGAAFCSVWGDKAAYHAALHMPPEQIILSPDDIRGIDALIAELDRKVRDPGSYTSQEAAEFVRRWRAAKLQ